MGMGWGTSKRIRSWKSVAAGVLVLTCALPSAAIAAGDQVTVAQDDDLLLHRPASQVDATLSHLAALGIDWVRVNATWSQIAPHASSEERPDFDADAPGAYPDGNWVQLDRVVRLAQKHGMRAMVEAGFYAPRWAVTRLARPDHWTRYRPDPEEFGRFGTALAKRYSGHYRPRGHDDPLPAAAAFVLWNEPNHPSFLLPQWTNVRGRYVPAAPAIYRRMVQAAYAPMKRAAPSIPVLIGNTSSTGMADARDHTSGLRPLRFLRELACVNRDFRPRRTGSCAGFTSLPGDGWAHHPYTGPLKPHERHPRRDNVPMGQLRDLSSTLRELHERGRVQRSMDIWITEFGYQTNPPDPTVPFGLGSQARFLGESELIAYNSPNVRSFAQFLLRDSPERRAEGDLRARWRGFQTGLQYFDGTPKPAEQAFRHTLVVRGLRNGMVSVWGHIRPGHGSRLVRITSGEPGGRFVQATGFPGPIRTTDLGYFAAVGPPGPGSAYRVEVEGGDSSQVGIELSAR